MALDNLITVEFSEENLQKMKSGIGDIRGELTGKAVNLTPQERRQYGRIADTNKIFVDKCREYMQTNPDTIPRGLDMEEFEKDYAARKQLEPLVRDLTQLREQISDTKTLLDYDNYTAAITYYRYVKFLAGTNEPGTTSIYQDLSKHFQSTAKRMQSTPDADNTATDASEAQ